MMEGIQFATGMGQHYQEESEGRQAEEGGKGYTAIIARKVPNDICGTKRTKLTVICESFSYVKLFYV